MNKSILFVAYIPNWGESDAANRHVVEVVTQFVNLGNTVKLYIPDPVVYIPNLPDNIQIVPISVSGKNQFLMAFIFHINLISKILQELRADKIKFIYGRHHFLDCMSLVPLRIFYKFKFISEINGIRSIESNSSKVVKKIIRFFERCSLRSYSKVIAVTEEIEKWAQSQCRETLTVANGVDVDFFKPQDQREVISRIGLDPRYTYLNFTGSLKPWHGTKLIINALPILLKKNKMIRIVIVGDGPERNILDKIASDKKIEEYIIWVGRVDKIQVRDYITASHICLAPINLDKVVELGRSSLKIFEYMACGKPYVTNAIGKHYDRLVQRSGAGLLIADATENEFASSIIKLLNSKKTLKEMGTSGRTFVEQNYSWLATAQKIIEFSEN